MTNNDNEIRPVDVARMIEDHLYKLIELADKHQLELLSVLLTDAAMEARDRSNDD